MNQPQMKMPMDYLMRASLDMIRLRGDVDNAVVVLINHRTAEFKAGSLVQDPNRVIELLEQTLAALKKQHGNPLIISPYGG